MGAPEMLLWLKLNIFVTEDISDPRLVGQVTLLTRRDINQFSSKPILLIVIKYICIRYKTDISYSAVHVGNGGHLQILD